MSTNSGYHFGEIILAISACFILITGIVSPLSFFLAGKYTTKIKEPARPELTTNSSQLPTNTISAKEAAKNAVEGLQSSLKQPTIQSPFKTDTAKRKAISTPIDKNSIKAENCLSKNEAQNTIVTNSNGVFHSNSNKNQVSTSDKSKNASSSTHSNQRNNKANNLVENRNSKSTPNPDDYLTIYISNIPYKVNDSGMRELLKPFGGTIYSVHLSRDPVTKKRKGIAFIRMSKPEAAVAIEKLNGTNFEGRELVVKIANDHGKKPEESV